MFKQAEAAPVLKTIVKMGVEVSDEERALASKTGIALYTFKEVEVSGVVVWEEWSEHSYLAGICHRPKGGRCLWTCCSLSQLTFAPYASPVAQQVCMCVHAPRWG